MIDQAPENELGSLSDNRMSFIRLLESPEEREFVGEYEIASEARVTGQLNYHNKDLILRFLTLETNRDGLYKYTLSISAPAQYRLPKYETSSKGYYFEGGYSEEILSLASLFLRCRFFPISYVIRDLTAGPPMHKIENDFSYMRPQRNIDTLLFDESERNFVPFGDFLDQITKLPEDLHHDFANAARLYARAVKEIGVDDQIAYVHLVSSVEILSKHVTLPEDIDPLQNVMAQLKDILKASSIEARSDLGNLFDQRKTMMKFVQFITNYKNEHIENKPSQNAKGNKIYNDNLTEALKRIYRGRSKFLHEGSSMYMGHPRITEEGCDYDSSVGQTIDNREFVESEKLPNIVFFEGLVRACLMNYLSNNTVNS